MRDGSARGRMGTAGQGAPTGIDTNVLVHFLTREDPAEAAVATAFMAGLSPEAPGFVPREVVLELVKVLERSFDYRRADVARALKGLLAMRGLKLEAADRVAEALGRYRRGGPDFADLMILLAAREAGCAVTVTFDAQSAAMPEGRLLAVAPARDDTPGQPDGGRPDG
jgi:predicted nucleic-acid-binding protein